MHFVYRRATGDRRSWKLNTIEKTNLLAAKKTTYIELNTSCTNQISNWFQLLSTRGSPVTQKLSQKEKCYEYEAKASHNYFKLKKIYKNWTKHLYQNLLLSKVLRQILFLSCLCFYLVLFREQYEVCFDGIILMDNLLIFNHYRICFNSRFILFHSAFIILFE